MGIRGWAAAAAVAACAWTGSAQAEIISVNFRGVVGETWGQPEYWLGLPYNGVEGRAYRATYIFDTSLPQPALSVSFVVSGAPRDIRWTPDSGGPKSLGTHNQYIAKADYEEKRGPYPEPGWWEWYKVAFVIDHSFSTYPMNSDATSPFSMTFNGENGMAVGYIAMDFDVFEGASYHLYATLLPQYVSITVGSAVPEPSTWAMMLIGFAGLGYAGYRRRREVSATA